MLLRSYKKKINFSDILQWQECEETDPLIHHG